MYLCARSWQYQCSKLRLGGRMIVRWVTMHAPTNSVNSKQITWRRLSFSFLGHVIATDISCKLDKKRFLAPVVLHRRRNIVTIVLVSNRFAVNNDWQWKLFLWSRETRNLLLTRSRCTIDKKSHVSLVLVESDLKQRFPRFDESKENVSRPVCPLLSVYHLSLVRRSRGHARETQIKFYLV